MLDHKSESDETRLVVLKCEYCDDTYEYTYVGDKIIKTRLVKKKEQTNG
jgi:hypothetical protein